MPLIELQEVHKYYHLGEKRIAALKGVDLTISKGEFVAIWGPSGSGKSTLCNLIGALDNPSSGVVLLEGRTVSELSDEKRSELRNRTIGFIFQGFNLIAVLSALENVMLPLQIRGEAQTKAEEKAIQHLSDLGLAEYVAHRPDKLSGGQQQRVAIARALIAGPAVVIADEPTANLDTNTAIKIIEIMQQLNRTTKSTFIFATHDQRLLERVDRRILLRDGLVVEDKTLAAMT
jgi:putative ABC transport system ATP-binding protein